MPGFFMRRTLIIVCISTNSYTASCIGIRPRIAAIMASMQFERIRDAILDQRHTLSEHAYEEMDDDHLDVLDVESAVLTGRIEQTLTKDPRGTRYVVIGTATDEATPVGVVVRFVEHDQLLVLTVYEVK